jgi:hypothetical protein
LDPVDECCGLLSQQRENRMSSSPQSVAVGAILVTLVALVAGGIVGFLDYARGHVLPMWPMWLIWFAPLVVGIPILIRVRRRRT